MKKELLKPSIYPVPVAYWQRITLVVRMALLSSPVVKERRITCRFSGGMSMKNVTDELTRHLRTRGYMVHRIAEADGATDCVKAPDYTICEQGIF